MSADHLNISKVRVEFSTVEDTRRLLFFGLAGNVPEHKRGSLANTLTWALRDAGYLGQSVEQHYSATDVARQLGRSTEWVTQRIKAGDFGPCARDGEWLIPASGVNAWLARQVFCTQSQEAAA